VRPAVARAVRARALWPLPRGRAAAVLAWHRVDVGGGGLAVHPEIFSRQMDILAEERERFPVVSIDQVTAELTEARQHARYVVLTFDDAWADNHVHVLGPLVRHRMPAMLYAPSRLLGAPGYMTQTQLLEMAASGVTIGAHSRTHPDLRTCGASELEQEILGSKQDLEDLIGQPVTSFAYPTGLLNDQVVAAVAAAGFTSAVTTRPGWWRPGTRPLQIPRAFAENFSDATFRAAIRGGLNLKRQLDEIKRVVPAMGGRS
jgi:peptidoglycan/xylan/chitin deacetylase (PgdA/CDA1 family)